MTVPETFAGALTVKTDGMTVATFRVAGADGHWSVTQAKSPRTHDVLGYRVIRVLPGGEMHGLAHTSTFLEAWRIAAGEASLAVVFPTGS